MSGRASSTETPIVRATIIGGFRAVAILEAGQPKSVKIIEGDGTRLKPIGRICLTDATTQMITELHFFAPSSDRGGKSVSIEISTVARGAKPKSIKADVTPADNQLLHLVDQGEIQIAEETTNSKLRLSLDLIRKARAAQTSRAEYAIDVATMVEDRLYIDGWIENGSTRGVFLISSDCSVLIHPEDMIFKRRRDVSQLLENTGREITTHHHGICAASYIAFENAAQNMLICSEKFCVCTAIGSFSYDRPASRSAILSRFWEAFGDGNLPRPRFSTDYIAPLIERPTGATKNFAKIVFNQHAAKPKLSIIVPLYGESFFVRSLLAMQQFMPDDYEWIFVCDDARIASTINELMRRRIQFMRGRTVLVLNHENYGYAASNNIGVLAATADTLLFMNSDIWIRSSTPIEAAFAELQAKRWTLLGFHLAFEDGTTQHDEIQLIRNPDYGGLYLAEHPRKGLPAKQMAGTIRPVLAVTGALFMVRRSIYDEIGGFNESFVKGDFEDADLCLRLVSRGARIGVVTTQECFHLERQSIKTIDSSTTRSVITYCNCVTFNSLWSDFLDNSAKVQSDRTAA